MSASYRPASMILTAGPSITDREVGYVADAVKNGWNERWSEYLVKFERAFADYIGVRYAMATSSATGALHLGLRALGVVPTTIDAPRGRSAHAHPGCAHESCPRHGSGRIEAATALSACKP